MGNEHAESTGVLTTVASSSPPVTKVVTSGVLTSVASSSPPITEVVTSRAATFPTALGPSQAAGVAGIRISRIGNDFRVEELSANEATIIGFVVHPLLNNANQVTAIAITQMGVSGGPSPLTPAQKGALTLIANELKHFGAPGRAEGRGGISVKLSWKGILEVVLAVADCAAAAAEEGANPIADAACLGAMTDVVMDPGDTFPSGTTDQGDPSGPPPDPVGSGSGDGGDDGGGDGGGEGAGGGGMKLGDGGDDGTGTKLD